ncbi:class I SAM-dependent methyltransferase [Mucilaginibacter sp. HD30]
MANNYDNAAWFYDGLSRLVFGKAIVNTQVYLLQYINPLSKILIVGGGTGWILEKLTALHPASLEITYVEVSAKMMATSAKRHTGANDVTFITSAVENVVFPSDFDVVVTPFLFDNFSDTTAQKVFNHLNLALKPDGLWLYADFELTDKLWQKMLLKTMHTFFKILCGVEATKLPGVKHLFAEQRYRSLNSKAFFGDFIRATVYHRQ